jgi:sporulation related protein
LLQKVGFHLEHWLLPRSRIVLTGLVCANVCLAFALIAFQEPRPNDQSALLPLDNQLKLVEEAVPTPQGEAIASVPDLSQTSTPSVKSSAKECRSWGPESDPLEFQGLQAQLSDLGGFPEIVEMQVQGKPDYLVYVANLGSRDNARRVSAELLSQNIESYLINRDDGSRILSVGVFSRAQLAQRQLKRVSDLGYAGQLEELPRAQVVYNLTAHVALDSDLYKTSTSACMAFAQNN